MHRQPVARWLTLSLVVTTLAAGSAVAQQKYRLRDTYSVGDHCTIDYTIDSNLNLSISARGQDPATANILNRDRRKYSQVILSVDAKGPSSVRRTYSYARGMRSDQYGNPIEQGSSLQGKTIVIKRQGAKVSVTPVKGKLAPAEQQSLMRELDYSDLEFFPKEEVAPGEQWIIDPKLVARMFPGMTSGEIRYHFQEVVQHAGHPCARIHITVDLAGQPGNVPLPITLKLEGDLFHALDLKRTLAVEITGPTTAEGELKREGTRVAIAGQGTMRIKETRQWKKVRGKPVVTSG